MRLAEGLDPNSVTPGVVGFLATFALVLVSIVLFVSMARRIRRMDYRARSEPEPAPPEPTPPEDVARDRAEDPPATPRAPDDDGPERGGRGGGPPAA